MFTRLIFSLGALFYFFSVAFAHGGGGPHGGAMSDFGNYHLEALLDGGKATFFVIDGDNKPTSIAKHEGGMITLVSPGKGAKVTKIPAGTDFKEFSAPVDAKGKIIAKVKLNVEGKSYTASFQLGK